MLLLMNRLKGSDESQIAMATIHYPRECGMAVLENRRRSDTDKGWQGHEPFAVLRSAAWASENQRTGGRCRSEHRLAGSFRGGK